MWKTIAEKSARLAPRILLVYFGLIVMLVLVNNDDFGYPAEPWVVPYSALLFTSPLWALPFTLRRMRELRSDAGRVFRMLFFAIVWFWFTLAHVLALVVLPFPVGAVKHVMG